MAMERRAGKRLESSILAANRRIDPQRIADYIEQLFTRDGDGKYVSVACVAEEFAVLLSGRMPPTLENSGLTPFLLKVDFESEQEGKRLFGKKLNELIRSQVQSVEHKNIAWPEAAYEERIRALSLKGHLEHYSFTHFIPAVASTLARGQIEAWDGLGFDEKCVTNLLLDAASVGDPEANYLLAAVGESGSDEQSPEFRKRDYLIPNEHERKHFFKIARESGHQGAYCLEYRQEMRNDSDAENERDNLIQEIEKLRKDAKSAGSPESLVTLGRELTALAKELDLDLSQRQRQNTNLPKWLVTRNESEIDRWASDNTRQQEEISRLLAESQQCFVDAAKTYPRALFWLKPPNESLPAKISRLQLAAYPEHGHDRSEGALVELASIYSSREWNYFSLASAVECLDEAIKLGAMDARLELARLILKNGDKTGKNMEDAVGLLRAEVDFWSELGFNDSGPAAFLLARCYLRGEGVSQDYDIAKSLFERWLRLPAPDASDGLCVYGKVACALMQQGQNHSLEATELLLKRLDCLDFQHEPEPMLSSTDVSLFRQPVQEAPAEMPKSSYFAEVTGFDNDLLYHAMLFALEYDDVVWLSADKFWTDPSISEHYFLGRLWLNGRFGHVDIDNAEFHLGKVHQQAQIRLSFEKKLNIRHASSAQETLHWFQDRARHWLLEAKNQRLEIANRQLTHAKAALEDLMGMFAHKFRGPVDSVVFNAEHQLDRQLFINIGRTMTGLLDIFSCVSTSSDILKPKLSNDCTGSVTLSQIVRKSLWLALVQLLPQRKIDLMSPHYFAYAIRTGRIGENVTFDDWQDEDRYLELQRSLSLAWELEIGSAIGSEMGDSVVEWCRQHLFDVRFSGIDESSLRCAPFGAKESVLVIVMTELFVNAIKHFNAEGPGLLELSWSETDEGAVFICKNPSSLTSRSHGRGSGRGHGFLRLIATNIDATFSAPGTSDDSIATIRFPSSLIWCAKP